MAKGSDERLKIRDEVAALKRERTIGAAAELFYRKGYDNTTLDEVAESLGVTKPFIYANFGSKSELLAEICERGVQASSDELDRALAEGLPARATLQLFARRYVLSILGAQKSIAIYIREEKNLEPGEAKRIGKLRRTFVGRLAELLHRGAESGEFTLKDPTMAALAIVGAVSWSTFWYRPEGRLEVAEIAATMAGYVMNIACPSDSGSGAAGMDAA